MRGWWNADRQSYRSRRRDPTQKQETGPILSG
jgi:hypothetical protein